MLARALIALVLAAALASGLAGCGDDDTGSGGVSTTIATTSTTPSTAPTAADAYDTALRDASGALADLGGAVVSGDPSQQVQQSITSALADWQAAINGAQAVDLADPTLADQRDALVSASPAFVSAWTAVADEWATSQGNGLLELVQQRAPIAAGAKALSEAVDGAIAAAGDEARGRLEDLRSEINSALEEIQSR
jgi:hypothetical protein